MTAATVSAQARDTDVSAFEVRSLTAGYGRTTVLREVSFAIPTGSVVALLGANGAGKTTLLRTAAGLLEPTQGNVILNGSEVSGLPPNRRARAGLCLIPEGRGIFRELTVRENLRLLRPAWVRTDRTDLVLQQFPVLGRRLRQTAGSMSGGEQQMLALARAFLCEPEVVMIDEASMGLSPIAVEQIFGALKALAETGVSLLLVEQYVEKALEMADLVVLIDSGTITFAGPTAEVDHDSLLRSYLGRDVE